MKTLFKLLILLLFKKANAQSNLWLGTSSLNWNDSLNWSLKSVPNETDTIILNNCDSVILENDIITADLLLSNSSINLNNHRITLIDSLSIEESNLYNGLIKSDSTIACYLKRNSFHSTIDLNLRSIYNFSQAQVMVQAAAKARGESVLPSPHECVHCDLKNATTLPCEHDDKTIPLRLGADLSGHYYSSWASLGGPAKTAHPLPGVD